MDGGLERLVRILHEFCLCPSPPENPAIFYGLMLPSARPAKLAPALNPPTFDKHAAYRFSLAFQCIVNIGVRGSEPIRSRVVQAGTLDVVGCILEAWLANKGFAVGPSAGAISVHKKSREQRHQYIFSENIGVLGDIAAGKEQTFGMMTARALAWIGDKLHYPP
jgi:hypothetical protein